MVISAYGVVEYIIETSEGVLPTNPAMAWIGRIQKANIDNLIMNEDVRSLKAAAATNKAEIATNVKTGENGNFKLEYMPQDFTFMKAALNDDAGTAQKDAIDSFSLGLISTDATPKYTTVQGCKISSWMCEIAEDKLGKVNAEGLYMHMPRTTNDPWTTDYIGSGSHASELATAPKGWADVTVLTLGGVAFKATNIKFGIKNALQVVKDGASSNSTKIASIGLQKRDYVFSAKVRRDAINDFSVKALGYGANDIVLTWAGTTFTFANAKVPFEKYNFDSEGLSEMDLNFAGITSLTLS